jgi:hypothetical protein
MAKLVCSNEKCGDVLVTDTLSAKTLVCDKCYSPRNVHNPDYDPSKGIGGMQFFDNGSGRKKVL